MGLGFGMGPESFGFACRRWRLTRIVAAALVAGLASFGLAGEAQALTPSTTTLSAAPNPGPVGQSITFTATVSGASGTPTGTISFNFGDGTTTTGTVSGGVATANHSYAAVGPYSVFATYSGDINYLTSSGSTNQTITQAATIITFGSTPYPSAAGQPVTFTATVSNQGVTPTGFVQFNFGDGTSANGTLSGGVTTAIHTYSGAGAFTAVATYLGDANYAAGGITLPQNVSSVPSTTVLGATPNPVNAGQSVPFTATVSGAGGPPTGTVTFDFGDGISAPGTLSGGVATVNHAYVAAGAYTVTATYNGNPIFQASSATGTVNVAATSSTVLAATPNPSNVGQSAVFTATVSGTGGTPTGTVTFNFADGTTSTVPLAGGIATANHAYAASGAFTVTATYNGDVHFQVSTATLQQTVSLAATTVNIASSQNPSQAGQAVTFTATASSGGGTPGGSVTFKDGAAALGTTTLAGGVATFTTASLTLGSHAITASYGGSASFAASNSAALIQAVNTPADSLKLRALQKLAAPVVAQNSGQAISGAVDSAITEGFADGGTFVTPGASGIRFNFAADPEAQGEQTASTLADPSRQASSSQASSSQAYSSQAYSSQAYSREGTRRVDDAFAALTTKAPAKAPPRYAEPRDWLAWAEVHGATLDHWGTSGAGTVPTAPLLYGNQVNLLAGVTRRLLPNFLIGVLGGYETFDYRSDALQGRLKGDGWTVGSYLGWMITQNVRFDAAVTYSGIGYDGLAGTAAGTFSGQRWLASLGLTGNYKAYGLLIEPSARIYALWEHENAYTDSLGMLQTARDFSTGRASGGVKLAYPLAWTSTAEIAPYVGIYGDYYFNADNAAALVAPAVPTAFVMDAGSARATAGIAAKFGNGAQIAIGGERGGIGGNFALWTYRARASVPFGAQ
jgi:Autotransporter beta-domain/Bacterial Ig-like domain (group 3)